MVIDLNTMAKKQDRKLYVETLSNNEKDRYLNKTAVIGVDPYEIPNDQWSISVENLPCISYPDIVNYLICAQSPYTMEQMKAYKSLESYNYFVSGWVRDCCVVIKNEYYVVSGKVMHSQRAREKPLHPWIIAEKAGKILCGHCTCMAGIGEVCSHVGALLFLVDSTVRIRDSQTVTQEKAYWMLPTQIRNIEYKPVRSIDFQSASSKKEKLDRSIEHLNSSSSCKVVKTPRKSKVSAVRCKRPSDEEFSSFLGNLSKCSVKPAILSLIQPFSYVYIPKIQRSNFPPVMSALYDDKYVVMPFNELISHCEKVKLEVSPEEAKNVELATKKQSESTVWFAYKTGRITASRFKAACRTDPSYPSQSLIMAICYPQAYKFKTPATVWGCSHEKNARDQYFEIMKKKHDHFHIMQSGLVINPAFPYMGASPDGIIQCECCNKGCLEVKCPYCYKSDSLSDDCFDIKSSFYLEKENGVLKLKHDHAYYYQVQTQINLCNVEYCDFVVWTERDIHVERIYKDVSFWNTEVEKAKNFFIYGILPEICGKFYSKPTAYLQTTTQCNKSAEAQEEFEEWCYCRKGKDSILIGCDNDTCVFKWFHFECVGVKSSRKGKWYCPDCRKLPQFKRGGKKS